MKLGLLLEV